MDKKLILAVAGAGKTYKICNSIDSEKKNLILAYTNQNIYNLQNEIYKKFNCIPNKTTVMTFDSFLYRFFIRPFEPIISQHFETEDLKSKGVTILEPPQQRINGEANNLYIKDDKLGHYYLDEWVFCERMSKLILKTKKRGEYNLFDTAIASINLFYENIYIDEYQDYREYDYEFLSRFIKKCKNIMLVGDYYQHSVSGKNNTGKPFLKGKVILKYNDYIESMRSFVEIDDKSLSKSRRCPDEICTLVKTKLKINIESKKINEGHVRFLEDIDEIKDVLNDDTVVKLIYNNSTKYNFKSCNWGYSKGNTYDETCVILTDKFEMLDADEFDINNKKITSNNINYLYVALTRTKGNLYIIKKKLFDKVKKNYLL